MSTKDSSHTNNEDSVISLPSVSGGKIWDYSEESVSVAVNPSSHVRKIFVGVAKTFFSFLPLASIIILAFLLEPIERLSEPIPSSSNSIFFKDFTVQPNESSGGMASMASLVIALNVLMLIIFVFLWFMDGLIKPFRKTLMTVTVLAAIAVPIFTLASKPATEDILATQIWSEKVYGYTVLEIENGNNHLGTVKVEDVETKKTKTVNFLVIYNEVYFYEDGDHLTQQINAGKPEAKK